jgi:hypothetical protein
MVMKAELPHAESVVVLLRQPWSELLPTTSIDQTATMWIGSISATVNTTVITLISSPRRAGMDVLHGGHAFCETSLLWIP